MTLPLLVVIPLSAGDLPLATALLKHLQWLGPIPHHAVLFVADQQLTDAQWNPLLESAKPIFPGGGQLIRTPLASLPAYPQAHNLRFETAAKHIATHQRAPWLFLSPRCVPMRKGWLLELENEYYAHSGGSTPKPIMGQVLTPEAHKVAQKLVPATAVYPPELPKRALQRLVIQRDRDFELACADLFVPLAHPTTLIVNHPMDGTDGVPTPPAVASLVFTAKAKELAARVRGEKVEPKPNITLEAFKTAGEHPYPDEAVRAGIIKDIPNPPAKPTYNHRTSYYHSGNLGDVIYGLAAIKLAGGGRLILGPQARKTPPCSTPIKEEAYERLEPLLACQPYLGPSRFSPRHPGTDAAVDLNHFRDNWNDQTTRARTGINNLARMHAYTLQVDEKFHPNQTWLTLGPHAPIRTPYFIVHRSQRYRAEGDKAFPWAMVLKRYRGRLLFVGLPTEHLEFQKFAGFKLPYFQCVNFLELARVIAGGLGFIGNQSLPMSIALGLGVRVLQEHWPECPDCTFARGNFLSQPLSEGQLEGWEGSTL